MTFLSHGEHSASQGLFIFLIGVLEMLISREGYWLRATLSHHSDRKVLIRLCRRMLTDRSPNRYRIFHLFNVTIYVNASKEMWMSMRCNSWREYDKDGGPLMSLYSLDELLVRTFRVNSTWLLPVLSLKIGGNNHHDSWECLLSAIFQIYSYASIVFINLREFKHIKVRKYYA